MKTILSLLVAALLLGTSSTFAQSTPPPARIYLVTVAPAAQVQAAFGHALLEVEQNIDENTMPPEQVSYLRDRNSVYDYGQPNITALLMNGGIVTLLGALLNDAVPSQATLDSRARFEGRYHAANRTWVRELLALNADQATALATLLRRNYIELRRTRGYQYRNFSDNCATRVRDAIFAVLPPEARATLEAEPPVPTDTYYASVSAALDTAAAAHSGSLSFVPAELTGSPYEQMVVDGMEGLGVPRSVSGGAEFFSLMNTLAASLADPTSGLAMMASTQPDAADGTSTIAALQGSFSRFSSDIATTPANGYQALYTPARLRARLQAMGLITSTSAAETVTQQP